MQIFSAARVVLGAALFSFSAASVTFAQSEPQIADEDLVVMSHWSVRLPFTLDDNDPMRVGEVLDDMWVWIKPGMKITSVNGIELGNLNAIRAVLRMSTELTDQTQLLVSLGTDPGENGETADEMAVLPIIQDTVLKNGMHFETMFQGSTWVSTLVASPADANTDLRVGDKLLSYEGEAFDMRESVQQIFQRERRKGAMQYDVAYLRNGDLRTGFVSLIDADVAAPDVGLLAAGQSRDPEKVVVLSQWNVRLPMEADPQEPATVMNANDMDRIDEGDVIVSVNGISVGNINALSPVLRLATEIDDQTDLTVDIGVLKSRSGNLSVETLSLPIVQDTVLGNGLRFETVFKTHSWETTLVSVPEGVDTDLTVGDRILAYGNGEPVNARTSIKDIIEKDRRKGMDRFEVIVYRDGEFMTCHLVI